MPRSLFTVLVAVAIVLAWSAITGACAIASTADAESVAAPVLAGDSVIHAQSSEAGVRVLRLESGAEASEIARYGNATSRSHVNLLSGGGNVLIALAEINVCGYVDGEQSEDLGFETEPEYDCIQASRFLAGPLGAFTKTPGCLTDSTQSTWNSGFQHDPTAISGDYFVRPLGRYSVCGPKARLNARELQAPFTEHELPFAAASVRAVALEGSMLAVTESINSRRFALVVHDLKKNAGVYRLEFSSKRPFEQGLDVQADGSVAMVADVCKNRRALVTISPKGKLKCLNAAPFGYDVRLADGRLAYYERNGRLTTRRLDGSDRAVLRTSADPEAEPFDFDGSRATWAEVGCRTTEIRLETLTPGIPIAPVRCPMTIPGGSVEIVGNKRIEIPLRCSNGCLGEWLLTGPASLKSINADYDHRISENLNEFDQPAGETVVSAVLREEYVDYFRKRHPKRIRLTWLSIAGTINGSTQKKSFWVNVRYR